MLNSTQIISLLNIKGIGTHTVYKIWSSNIEFIDLKDLYEYLKEEDIKPKRYDMPSFEEFRKKYNSVEELIEKAKNNNIHIVPLGDESYPEQLAKIPKPPLVLYIKGNKDCLNNKLSIAIIGTRKPTDYGEKVAKRFGEYFAENNFVVVSGLALGCDTAAHVGCLDKNGKTVAVLAHGLDKVYPAKNKKLAEEIIDKGGCLISEYSLGVPAMAGNFVARDRIQSGLSLGVLVVETGIKSGTMHTVEFCKEQHRILACYKPPERLRHVESVLGNIKLLSEGAWGIEDKTSLNNYVDKLLSYINNNYNNWTTTNIPHHGESEFPLFKDIEDDNL